MQEDHDFGRGRFLLKKRPYFGRKQVRSLKGIRVGIRYHDCNGVGRVTKTLIEITGKPYTDGTGWWVRCQMSFDHGRTWHENQTISLEDNNVVPYIHNGKWNPSNWLERL